MTLSQLYVPWCHLTCSTTMTLSYSGFFLKNEKQINLHGSLAMNWGTVLGRGVLGFGVPTSLFLAIFVFALANSSRSVCGISGSKRMPLGNKEQMEDVIISWESNRDGDKTNTPVKPGLCKPERRKSATPLSFTGCTEHVRTCNTTSPERQGDFVYLIFSSMGFQLFFMTFSS